MNSKIEPVLEKYVKDDENKEITESTHILTTSPQEVVKPKPNPVIIEQQKKILENQEKLNKESKEFRFSQKMKEEGKVRGRRNTSFFPPSLNFLKSFDVIEKPNYNINEEPKGELEDLSLGKNIIEKEDTSDMENLKSIYGYNQKEEFNPVLQSLQKRLEELQNKREEIKKQFEYDKKLYQKRIKNLEEIKNTQLDEKKLKFLKNEKKQNEKIIVELKIKIEQTEKDTIQDREKLEGQLNYISELKNNLIKEISELQILANKSSFEDYNDYMKNDPTKIEKTNFRPDDSRYLLTNEYETSRDEEESISSYDKLNHINNTPEGFEINRQNIYLNKTFNNNYSHINTKSSKVHLGTNNDVNINEKNVINVHNKTFNKGTEDTQSKKKAEIKQQQQPIQEIKNPETNNSKKTYPRDPEFLNDNMILIRNDDDDRDSDTFY